MVGIYHDESKVKIYLKNNWIGILSLVISVAVAVGQFLGPIEYYKTSKVIIENDLYSSLEYIDSYIDIVTKTNSKNKNDEQAMILFDQSLQKQADDINKIDKSRLPKNKVLSIMTAQYKTSSGINTVRIAKGTLPNVLSDENQRNEFLSVLYYYRSLLKQQILYFEQNKNPDIKYMKKTDENFSREYGSEINKYKGINENRR